MGSSDAPLLFVASPAVAEDVIPLASGRELFVDRYVIDKRDRAELRLQTPRDEGLAVPLDQPEEGACCAYFTISISAGGSCARKR